MEDSTTETIDAGIEEKVNRFAQGDLKHAAGALSALWEILNKDGDIKAPSNTSPAVSSLRFCLLESYRSANFTSPGFQKEKTLPGCAGHEPSPLGCRKDRAHQVTSQRDLL